MRIVKNKRKHCGRPSPSKEYTTGRDLASQPDVVEYDKEQKTAVTIDMAIPADSKIGILGTVTPKLEKCLQQIQAQHLRSLFRKVQF